MQTHPANVLRKEEKRDGKTNRNPITDVGNFTAILRKKK